jgi:phenylpyruvate tautomerase PptA (4-oxalocrotonate tautomerase family)
MPHFNVQIREEELDGKIESELIRALTEAVVTVYGERARALAVVELFGIPQRRWGIGGVPAEANAPVITLNMREPALKLTEIGNAPARLIASITDAVVTVFGEPVRKDVTVLIVGVPAGRSGVGGEVV